MCQSADVYYFFKFKNHMIVIYTSFNTRSTTWVIFDPRGFVEGPTPLHDYRRTERSRAF